MKLIKVIKVLFIAALIIPIYFVTCLLKKNKKKPYKYFLLFLFSIDKDYFLNIKNIEKQELQFNLNRLEDFNKISLPDGFYEKQKLIHKKQRNFIAIKILKQEEKNINLFFKLLIFFKYES